MAKFVSFELFNPKTHTPFLILIMILTLLYYLSIRMKNVHIILGIIVILLGLINLYDYNRKIAKILLVIICIIIIFGLYKEIKYFQ